VDRIQSTAWPTNCANFTSGFTHWWTGSSFSMLRRTITPAAVSPCRSSKYRDFPTWMANNIVLATDRYIHVHVAHFAVRRHRSLVTGAYQIHLSRPFRMIICSVFSFLRRISARRIACMFRHIVIVSEQQTTNQTPYDTWFADQAGETANQIRYKAASSDTFVYRDHVQEIRSDYVASPVVL